MNLYTFDNEAADKTEILEWLWENCFRRYRIVRLTSSLFIGHRGVNSRVVSFRYFHSQTNCFQPWARFFPMDRNVRKRRFIGLYTEHTPVVGCRYPISIIFDNVADMIYCKLRWHNHNTVV